MTSTPAIVEERVPGSNPRGLRLLPERGTVSVFELVLLALAIAAIVLVRSVHLQDVLILSFLFAGLALAWNIAGGYVGLISFGHAAFFGIGAYASTILLLSFEVSPWLGLWAGGAVAAAFGAILALVCARLRGPFFILSTLASAEVVRILALNWASLTGGPEGLSIPPVASFATMVFDDKASYAVLMLAFLLIVYVTTKVIEGSRFGYQLFAVRDDEDAAAAAGIDPLGARTKAMAISAFFTGIGGSLFAQYFLYLDPTHMVSPELSFQFALLPAIGGLGTAIGPVLGAFLITPLSEFLRSSLGNAASGLHLAIYGGLLVVVMLYFPGGIAGALKRAKRG